MLNCSVLPFYKKSEEEDFVLNDIAACCFAVPTLRNTQERKNWSSLKMWNWSHSWMSSKVVWRSPPRTSTSLTAAATKRKAGSPCDFVLLKGLAFSDCVCPAVKGDQNRNLKLGILFENSLFIFYFLVF